VTSLAAHQDELHAASATLDLQEAAGLYALHGWPVLPLCPGTCPGHPQHFRCEHPGKMARIREWQHKASTDPYTVARWWDRWPDSNIGVVTGRRSGVMALDIDPRHDGMTTVGYVMLDADPGTVRAEDLPDQAPRPLPMTAAVVTGTDGYHVYMRWAEGITNSNKGLRRYARDPRQPGVDVRGEVGYLVAPPSIHASGQTYRWLRSATGSAPEIPPAPGWLVDLLLERDPAPEPPRRPAGPPAPRPRAPHAGSTRSLRYVEAALVGILDDLAGVGPGDRNNAVNYAAWRVGWLVRRNPALDFDEGAIVYRIAQAAAGLPSDAQHPPLDPRSVQASITSGLDAGKAGKGRPSR
jgi:hypothetical protein